jgi:hypothetical protein
MGSGADWLAIGAKRHCLALRREARSNYRPNSWRVQLFVVVFLTGAMLLFDVMGFSSMRISFPFTPRIVTG